MEIVKKEITTSYLFDNTDILAIYEYGEATFGEKLADFLLQKFIRPLKN